MSSLSMMQTSVLADPSSILRHGPQPCVTKKSEEIDSKITNGRLLARRSRHGEIHGAKERVSVIALYGGNILCSEEFVVDLRIGGIWVARKCGEILVNNSDIIGDELIEGSSTT